MLKKLALVIIDPHARAIVFFTEFSDYNIRPSIPPRAESIHPLSSCIITARVFIFKDKFRFFCGSFTKSLKHTY